MRLAALGDVAVQSVYGAVGRLDSNRARMHRLSEEMRAEGLPYIGGGDHNLPPSGIAQRLALPAQGIVYDDESIWA